MFKKTFVMLLICISLVQAYQNDADFQVINSFILSLKPARIPLSHAQEIAHWCVYYGQQFKVDPLLVAALIYRESTFNHCAVSVTGAQGLGQIKSMNFAHLDITDPFDIKQNIKGTTQYLKEMLNNWVDHPDHMKLGLASYFKGFTGVKRDNNKIEGKTAGYVQTILDKYHQLLAVRKTAEAL